MSKEISKLNNDISYIYRYNANTPRMAVCLNMSINNPEKSAGIYPLMAKLFLQIQRVWQRAGVSIADSVLPCAR